MNRVLAYHETSKHHLERYAPGPGGLDWASQPEPFRHYAGAPQFALPLLVDEDPVRWDALFAAVGAPPQLLNQKTLAQLLELSLGLSAWKTYGNNRWALRCNPSSGNLHPTEAYLICPGLDDLPGGVYHYCPDQHALEQRAAASLPKSDGVLVALTGIHWREAWKYGLRAYRYCQHDCGHALAALAYAAAILGWPARRLDWGDAAIAALSGIDRAGDFPDEASRESPEALVWIGPGAPPTTAVALDALHNAHWQGQANRLSSTHRDWPQITQVNNAASRTGAPIGLAETASGALDEPTAATPLPARGPASTRPASQLIRRRRSAQAFDGVTALAADRLYTILDALLPRAGHPPWSLRDAAPEVHPVLFIHRVDGLAPGIYVLPRSAKGLSDLRAALLPDGVWARVSTAPGHLPLYLLAPMDVRAFAATASCHQDIAADSAFMVAMLGRIDDIDTAHPWRYRERFWEAGMLGQVLYLEAEAAGVQGTGIGCYFDDVVHRALQLDTTRYQDLYQFTVGAALIDDRLGSESGYAHLGKRGA